MTDVVQHLRKIRMDSLIRTNKLPEEFRLHPEDYAELKKQCDYYFLHYPPHFCDPEIFGVTIVVDVYAARIQAGAEGESK